MTEQELILTSILNCDRIDLYVDSKPLSHREQILLEEIKLRRLRGEPLQYILGSCDFLGIQLKVDPQVFIPRPETELLVELALKKVKDSGISRPLKILELGTGSGNIAISLCKNLPFSNIVSLDISQEALALAQFNAKMNFVEDRIDFLCEDLFSYFEKKCFNKFDIIISNPPYIPGAQLKELPLDVRHEPPLALDGGEDGLDFYRFIIAHAHRFLKKQGFLLLEIGDGQKRELETIFNLTAMYKNIQFFKDYSSKERMVLAWKN